MVLTGRAMVKNMFCQIHLLCFGFIGCKKCVFEWSCLFRSRTLHNLGFEMIVFILIAKFEFFIYLSVNWTNGYFLEGDYRRYNGPHTNTLTDTHKANICNWQLNSARQTRRTRADLETNRLSGSKTAQKAINKSKRRITYKNDFWLDKVVDNLNI